MAHSPTNPGPIGPPKKKFREWAIPGPVPPGGVAPESAETLDALSGHWRIFQKKKGHRFSTDDVVCAWYASQWAPRVDAYCDLGSGIGSVAMMVAWRRPGCRVVTLEAQAESHALQKKSILYNGLSDRFTPLQGDVREVEPVARHGPFDLVTGSPPYWAETSALPAQTAQQVGARLETRGTVFDYAHAAAQILAPGGVFALVYQAAIDDKVRAALDAAALTLLRARPVRFKGGVPAAKSGAQVYVAARCDDVPPAQRDAPFFEPPLTIRAPDGTVDAEYARVKMSLGFPP